MASLARTIRLGAGAAALAALLTACGDRNTYQPPPPAEVTVAKPEQRKVTLYMEVTGSTADRGSDARNADVVCAPCRSLPR